MKTIEKLCHLKLEVEACKNFRGKDGVIRKIDRFISLAALFAAFITVLVTCVRSKLL